MSGKGVLIEAKTIPEALSGMKEVRDCLAGGTYVLSSLFGERPHSLLSLRKIPELAGITDQGEWVRIGALVTFQEALKSASVPSYAREALLFMGSRTRRNMATLGGNAALWRGDSYLAPMLLSSGAMIETAREADGEVITEMVPAAAFPKVREKRLILAICLRKGIRARSVRYANTVQSHADLTVSLASDGGKVTAAVAEKTAGVFLITDLFSSPSDHLSEKEIRSYCDSLTAIQSDYRCSGEYKRYLLSVALKDLFSALKEEAVL